VDETPASDGRYGAALLFVRWTPAGEEPAGHVESGYLAYGREPAEAEAAVRDLTLHQVKEQLDQAVARAREIPDWS
jgi:hypothetical protein